MPPTERTRLERVLFAKTRQQDKDISHGVRRVKYGPSGRHFLTPMAQIPDEDLVALVRLHEPPRRESMHRNAPAYYITAEDITGSRCTVTGCYRRRADAEAAVERDDQAGVFESDYEIEEGVRAHHLDGAVWVPEQTPNRHGVYHDTAAQEGDYVIHKHGYSGFYWADRVQRGGTHVKIGPAKGWKTREEAIEGIRKDSHTQGFQAGVIFESRGDELAQIGHVNSHHDVSEHAPNARFGELPPAPRGGPADEEAARELSLFIENDYELVGKPNSRGQSIEKNLLKKIKNGTFDLARSEDLWMYLIEDGAKKYAKEFAQPHEWNKMFNKATRELVAHEFATTFYEEAKLGNIDGQTPNSAQPYRGSQMVIIEKRDAQGRLDMRGKPQPPARPMKFDDVYDLYFREVPEGRTAGWNDLEPWLDAKGWVLRAKTW